jgi:hypothetical protein
MSNFLQRVFVGGHHTSRFGDGEESFLAPAVTGDCQERLSPHASISLPAGSGFLASLGMTKL